MRQSARNESGLFFAGLLALWLAVIFAFSAMPGSPWPQDTSLAYLLERKGAHVVEYFILTWLIFAFLRAQAPQEGRLRLLIGAVVCALAYAATDELHQFFVPYRGASLRDVGIDLFGILLAAGTLALARFRRH
ncbi:MAG: VanZ family protein [Candidatus Moraniibacteriota bacterium]